MNFADSEVECIWGKVHLFGGFKEANRILWALLKTPIFFLHHTILDDSEAKSKQKTLRKKAQKLISGKTSQGRFKEVGLCSEHKDRHKDRRSPRPSLLQAAQFL